LNQLLPIIKTVADPFDTIYRPTRVRCGPFQLTLMFSDEFNKELFKTAL